MGEQRVAVLEDDKVAEVYLERPERRSIAGNIYLGQVDNVLPGMEAAFVEIGLEKNGFLYVDEIVGPELERGHGRKIQDLISRGQTILVQAVKDPMKTKGARLTTQISLPGRFVVFVPQGEGLGVSRRLDDEERSRLKEILKKLAVKEGGLIVRTAAEGASEEDIERDLVFLQRLWKSIQAKANQASPPELIYQEAELPLRVTRDLFTGDFVKAYVDNDQAYKRITGYLKKTSPHMVERVVRYREKTPLMEAFGVEQEIKSTLHRRVDLPSGGYLIFDYAEAFTVIDVNTGRFVGSRGKNSGARLEDTITKNNLEAVKEVVRQLRLRDIGGIIVIDFIDMANPKNRAAVEEALRTELERDRTKTYVVEISPLGLVEMTRQNVTDGPRELMTKKCPTCGGDGIVYSEASAAIDVERRLRTLVAGSRSQAYRVELAAPIAAALIGPGAKRLQELEAMTKRRFFLDGKPRHARRPLRRARRRQARRSRAGRAGRRGRGAAARAGRGRPARQRRRGRQGRRSRRLRRRGCVARRQAREGAHRAGARRRRVRDARAQREEGAGAADGGGGGREADAEAARAEGHRRAGPHGRGARRRGGARGRGRGRARGGGRRHRRRARARRGRRRAAEDEAPVGTAPAKKKTRRGSRGGKNRKKPAAKPADGEAPEAEAPEAEALEAEQEGAGEAGDDSSPRRRSRTQGRKGEGDGRGRCHRAGGSDPARCSLRERRDHPGEEEDATRLARGQEPPQAHRSRGRWGERLRAGGGRAGGRRAGGRATPSSSPQKSPQPLRSRPRTAPPRTIGATCPCPSGSTSSRAEFATLAPPAGPVGAAFSTLMSYAIITLGGKQYRVQEGERLLVDRLKTDEGKTFKPKVLLVGGNGKTDLAPTIAVTARVVSHELGEKIRIGKYKKRTGYRKHTGFRASLTQIEIESIGAGARKAAAAAKPEAKPKAEAAPKPKAEAAAPARTAHPPKGYEEMTVAEITAEAHDWRRPNLEAALEYERANAKRKGAIAALESALADKESH